MVSHITFLLNKKIILAWSKSVIRNIQKITYAAKMESCYGYPCAVAQIHQTHSGATYGCPDITQQFWSKLGIGNIQKITAVRTIRMVTTPFMYHLKFIKVLLKLVLNQWTTFYEIDTLKNIHLWCDDFFVKYGTIVKFVKTY